jgi:hypothetical protein
MYHKLSSAEAASIYSYFITPFAVVLEGCCRMGTKYTCYILQQPGLSQITGLVAAII